MCIRDSANGKRAALDGRYTVDKHRRSQRRVTVLEQNHTAWRAGRRCIWDNFCGKDNLLPVDGFLW